jgi:Ca-activated chloride channel family protein
MKKNEQSHTTQREDNICDPGKILVMIYLGAIVFFLLLGSFSQASATTQVPEQNIAEDDLQTVNEVKRGELLISRDSSENLTSAPLLSQNVDISVSGMVINTVVNQRFKNTSTDWVEAVYVFPLPDESAVKELRMVVGGRVIHGEVKEKKEARAIYEQAKSEGKKSSLLTQKRPNIFTMAVANIPPESVVKVEIHYVDTVHFQSGVFSLRFPMVVGPRYIPGNPLGGTEKRIAFDERGWAADTDEVADASQITPPVTGASEPLQNPVQLTISLTPGFPVKDLSSLHHGVTVVGDSMGSYEIVFDGQVYADRDFVLEYRAANEKEISAALFTESAPGGNYTYLMLTPPFQKRESRVPREVIFVLDISGSMAGSSIRQAKEALVYGVSRLHEQDRFNVIVFNNSARKLFSSSLDAHSENREKASKVISNLEASGGTEISAALKIALDGRTDHQRIRQVVFLTDGAVGNEEALFSIITRELGDARLFTVGIGSAPNAYFMSRAATMGRGSYCYIGKIDEVNTKMKTLLERLEQPVVTGLHLQAEDNSTIEMYPNPLPDLYMGEPLVALLKSDRPLEKVRLSGINMGKPWGIVVENKGEKSYAGIGLVWARKKISSLMASLHFGAAEEEVRREVVKTALNHHLISRYTSLVAVEEVVSRPQNSGLENQQIKTNLPQGWQHAKVFGASSKTATPSTMLLLVGSITLLVGLLLCRQAWRFR